MNKLKTSYPAGVDFNWDDLAWMQDATRDAFYGLLSAFGIDPDESFILSGCAVTIGPSSASTTAGYIALSGEIYKVSAHSIVYDGSSPVVWRLQETDDATGTETDSTGSTVECYQKRVAVLYQASSYTSEMPYNAQTLQEVISEQLNINTEWVTVPYNAAYFTGTSLVMNSTNTKLYYKVIGRTLIFSFVLSVTSMDSSLLEINFDLITGKKITKQVYATGTRQMSGNNGPVHILTQVDPINNVLISEYGAVLAALSLATITGEIILEVDDI